MFKLMDKEIFTNIRQSFSLSVSMGIYSYAICSNDFKQIWLDYSILNRGFSDGTKSRVDPDQLASMLLDIFLTKDIKMCPKYLMIFYQN